MEAIAAWLVKLILEFLFKKTSQAAIEALEKARLDRERGVTNETNVKAYNDAQTRAERIKAAADLINRTHP